MQGVLKSYEFMTGQSINFDKSSVAFSGSVDIDTQSCLADMLGIRRVQLHDKYLGMPVTVGRSKVASFRFLVDRVKKKTGSWSARALSAAGREVLIKSVAQAIPSYLMNCFEIPEAIISELRSELARYWWSGSSPKKKLHWTSWKKLCENKQSGGLGFRDLRIFNLALLAKQGWRLLHQPKSMVARILKAKYYPNCTFMEATIPQNASYTWRSIISGRRVLEVGIRFRVGNGEKVKFYHDHWIPLPYGFRPFTRPPEGSSNLCVASFIDRDRRVWNKEMLCNHVSIYEAELIMKLPLSSSQTQDTLMWHFDKGGVYSVKSGYWVYADYMLRLHNAESSSANGGGSQRMWKAIWNINIPPKVRIFAWKAISGFIPTRASLARRHVNIEGVECLLCGDPMETTEHLFRDCGVVRRVWEEGGMHEVVDVTIRLPFTDWLHASVQQLDSSQVELFLMFLWSIWFHRNKVLWDKCEFSTSFITHWTIMQLKEYREAHEKAVSKQRRRDAKWCCPPRGRLKFNIDGAYDKEKSKGGVGVIVRDENGAGIAAIARPFEFALSPFAMELMALREGLRLAIRQGWNDIIIESDSILLVSAMHKGEGDLSETGNIIADCLELAKELGTISYCHIYREANQVADRLATAACGMELNQDWVNVMPSFILYVLLVDSLNCNDMQYCSINNTEERSVSNI